MFVPNEVDPFPKGVLPTIQETSQGADALKLLNATLLGNTCRDASSTGPISYSSTVQGVTLVLSPVGSYGLGCWESSAVITCCIAGTPSEATFFTVALKKFRNAVNDGITVLKADKKNANLFELDILGIRFSLQYHQSQYATCWSDIGDLDVSSTIPYMTRIRLNVYRDTAYLLSILPDHETFKLSYLVIKQWAYRHGLMSSRFGYLDETQLVWMVAKICKLVQPTKQHSVAAVAQQFFKLYSSFNYDSEIVSVSSDAPSKPSRRRSYGPGMAVISYHSPTLNISNAKSKLAVNIIKLKFSRTEARLNTQSWDFESLVNGSSMSNTSPESPDNPRSRFLSSFTCYIKIDISYWGSSLAQGGEFFDWAEAMISSYGNAPLGWAPRPSFQSTAPLPSRLAHEVHQSVGHRCSGLRTTSLGYVSSWFAAKAHDPTLSDSAIEEALSTFANALISHTSKFLTCLTSSSNYDETTSWIGICQVSSVDARYLHLDTKSWPLLPFEEQPDDISSNDECPTDLPARLKTKSTSVAKLKSAPPNHTSRPLRPALDILNRIRHDPAMDIADYIIGYVDRHNGTMEMPVTWWKGGDNTDEDFIPQSRVLCFRRKGDADGFRIWERERRIDRVFGSGNGSGDQDEAVS